MNRRLHTLSAMALAVVIPGCVSFGDAVYRIKSAHPRLLIEDVLTVVQRCDGPLAEDCCVVKQRADDAVRRGTIQSISNPGSGSRTLFLHVFEVTDGAVRQPTPVAFAAPAGGNIGPRWQVRFNPEGALGGTVNGEPVTTKTHTQTQYSVGATYR